MLVAVQDDVHTMLRHQGPHGVHRSGVTFLPNVENRVMVICDRADIGMSVEIILQPLILGLTDRTYRQ